MNIKEEIKELRKWIFLILFTVLSFWIVNNFNVIFGIISKILKVFFPFILGGVIAYILNIPMMKIESLLKKLIKKDKYKSLVRTISIILSLMIFVLVLVFIAFLLIPELIGNVESLISSIPKVINDLKVWVVDLLDKYPDIQVQINNAFSNSEHSVSSIVSSILNYLLNSALGFVGNLFSSFATVFTGLVFSIYMLSQKESLIKGFKKVLYAYVSKDDADKLIEVGKLANNTFSKFISAPLV